MTQFLLQIPFFGTKIGVFLLTEGSKNQRAGKAIALAERGSNSVGRVTAFQAVGRGFEPRLPLQLRIEFFEQSRSEHSNEGADARRSESPSES